MTVEQTGNKSEPHVLLDHLPDSVFVVDAADGTTQ